MAGHRIRVPDLVGFGWEEARDMGQAAGLRPRAVGPDGQAVNGKGGVVIDQNPSAGAKASTGDDFALRVAFGGGPAKDRDPVEPLPGPREFKEWVEDLTSDDIPSQGPTGKDRELAGTH